MSESGHPDLNLRARRLRGVLYAAVAAQVALWIAAVVDMYVHTNPKGDGLEWAAIVPASVILMLGVGPPLGFRREPRLLWVGALMAIAGLLLMAALMFEIVRELYH